MMPDRAAARFAAIFSARAGKRSERLPRRYRDCGNSARARRPPGDAPKSVRHRSRRYRSRRSTPGLKQADRANFVCAPGIGGAEIARDIERLVEILAVHHIEAEQLLFGFGKGPVEHDRRIVLA